MTDETQSTCAGARATRVAPWAASVTDVISKF